MVIDQIFMTRKAILLLKSHLSRWHILSFVGLRVEKLKFHAVFQYDRFGNYLPIFFVLLILTSYDSRALSNILLLICSKFWGLFISFRGINHTFLHSLLLV